MKVPFESDMISKWQWNDTQRDGIWIVTFKLYTLFFFKLKKAIVTLSRWNWIENIRIEIKMKMLSAILCQK